jgi:hypothetical protein
MAPQYEQAYRCSNLRQPAVAPALSLFKNVRDPEPVRAGLCCKSRPQRLTLRGIFGKPRLDFGMRRETGIDVLDAVARQLSVETGVQVVLL